eukprot:2747005-Prymnesium_polylepis.1
MGAQTRQIIICNHIMRCFCESRWAMCSQYTKDFGSALDLGKLSGMEENLDDIVEACTKGAGRLPPMMPDDFVEELEAKSFTNGKEDRPMVGTLYRAAFEKQMGEAIRLKYSGLGWGDE